MYGPRCGASARSPGSCGRAPAGGAPPVHCSTVDPSRSAARPLRLRSAVRRGPEDISSTGRHLSDRGHRARSRQPASDVAPRAELGRLLDVLRLILDRENDHLPGGMFLRRRPERCRVRPCLHSPASSTMTSGRRAWASAMASSAELASPTAARSSSAHTSSRRPALADGRSSTRRTRTLKRNGLSPRLQPTGREFDQVGSGGSDRVRQP